MPGSCWGRFVSLPAVEDVGEALPSGCQGPGAATCDVRGGERRRGIPDRGVSDCSGTLWDRELASPRPESTGSWIRGTGATVLTALVWYD